MLDFIQMAGLLFGKCLKRLHDMSVFRAASVDLAL
jgi:hypothetical protein